MGRKITVAACTLNLWAMDFEGNLAKILKSIKLAKKEGAKLRVGTELEICGYECQDHFLESDTFLHSIEILAEILKSSEAEDMLIFIGMPIMHKNVSYNCMVAIYNKQIILIRPKLYMCNSGNYRESRWFSGWRKYQKTEDYYLPRKLQDVTGQTTVPIGDGVISTLDTCIGCEICEELWTTDSPHTLMTLDGVEIFLNCSASHHELRKSAYVATQLVKNTVTKNGGLYVYTNQRGCGGDRLYFDGVSLICLNGLILARGKQFALEEVEVTTAVVDIEDVRSYRMQIRSARDKAAGSTAYPRFNVEFALSDNDDWQLETTSALADVKFHKLEEEIALGPACWLWDILRRSNLSGFFLPLSGGRDSASSACIVASMCRLICKSVKDGDEKTLLDIRSVVGDSRYTPEDPKELCNRIFVTCYLASEHSSKETRENADNLSKDIGSYHLSCFIDSAVTAVLEIFKSVNKNRGEPKFLSAGGEIRENLALQNIQARMRMVISYFFAQLTQWSRFKRSSLLVLGSANVDESLSGYFTKYDCSSADVNPIGGFSKNDLKKFLEYCTEEYGFTSLKAVIALTPTAELEPTKDGKVTQSDEADIGLTYDELSCIGKLRKPGCCGPYSMFCKLLYMWKDRHTPEQIADKVKLFFRLYSVNRHKMTIITPAYHAETYSPDDNRYDHRQFLYNIQWPWQFRQIDALVKSLLASKSSQGKL